MALAVALTVTTASGPLLAQDTTTMPWDAELIDPAGGADLILPMACGGAMAFQKVVVPVSIDDPLDDKRFRMGQSQAETGYSDYLRTAHLRGAFLDQEAGATFYYIARYELNVAQFRALQGDCAAPFTRRDRFAQGRLSWFDGINLSQKYTEWLYANAPDALAALGDTPAFLRLPTEEEWEYAVRGGAKIDAAQFPARHFFSSGDLGDFAHFQAAGQGRGKLRPVGLRKPNPLGLFDVYGNAEELVEEPFRLNAVGRPHGQVGGIVTRGGAIDAEASQIYSAQRREYPRFSTRSGTALAGEFFGLRLVISSSIISDAAFDAIRASWQTRADGDATEADDPLAALATLLEEEVDPRRQQALAGLQHEFRLAKEAAEKSRQQSAKSTLLSGAAFVARLREDQAEIQQFLRTINDVRDKLSRTSRAETRSQLIAVMSTAVDRLNIVRESQATSLLFYRTTLETLTANVSPELRQTAYLELGRELGAAELVDLLDDLNDVWGDVSVYAGQPDMDLGALLEMALG